MKARTQPGDVAMVVHAFEALLVVHEALASAVDLALLEEDKFS